MPATAPPGRPHRVVVLAQPGVLALDFGIPIQAFGDWPGSPYTVTVCTEHPGPVPVHGGPALLVEHGLDALAHADTIVVPGLVPPDPPSPPLRTALAAAAARGTRMVSICTGAFLLAGAGLLDGRRATTHWQRVAELARRHPSVLLEPQVLYVDAGDVLTSAGVAAGIDLCLHIIRADLGATVANQRARALVAAPHRAGGQAQFIAHPTPPERGGGLDEVRAWAVRHLDEPLTVDLMARRARLSRRTLIRRFHAETGLPPMQWLLDARIDRARELLEGSDLPMDAVARQSGLGTPANLRILFKRRLGVPPSTYRGTFDTGDRPL
ncbi:helix-turn-helix domain-containing protein (plasmid) [Embleya sp. NBC_00888]|uniref:GlxA family transcriptional regulator n=1 Tax=Embleya sp. NBC_00888 TaxID=2975960 RepID=UPI002F91B36A|nr:helix-turn-helix domain-containing protein [Embleya sp. NBC_00888]